MPAGIMKWSCEQVNFPPPTRALTGENVYSISQIYFIMKFYNYYYHQYSSSIALIVPGGGGLCSLVGEQFGKC